MAAPRPDPAAPIAPPSPDAPDWSCAVIASERFGDARAWFTAWRARLTTHARHPRPTFIPINDLLHRADAAAAAAAADAALLLSDAAEPHAPVLQAAARLREAGVPAIILRRACSPADRARLELADAPVIDAAADPGYIAGLAAGAARAGRSRRELEAELELAHRAHRQAERWLHRADDEMRLAARLQRDMLPHAFPSLPSLQFGACYRSAYYVGGDVYRLWRLDEHRVGLFIADAMGHGVRAAMQSMILAHALVLKETDPAGYRLRCPADALAALNRELLRDPHEISRFATAVAAVIDARTGLVRLANAGHPAPVVLAPGYAGAVDESGPALGAFDHAEFPAVEFTLRPGQSLVLHTDGLDAAVNASRGLDPLAACAAPPHHVADLLALDHDRPLDASLARFESRLDGLNGSLHAPDDVAVLAVRFNPA